MYIYSRSYIFCSKFLNDETKDQSICLNLSAYQQVQFEKQKSIPKEIEKNLM